MLEVEHYIFGRLSLPDTSEKHHIIRYSVQWYSQTSRFGKKERLKNDQRFFTVPSICVFTIYFINIPIIGRGRALCAAAFCTTLCAGHVSSISNLSRGQPNPRPDPLTLALTLTQTLWGARGRQGHSRGAACFGGVFF